MKALYFSWVRERIGTAEEDLAPPDEVRTVGGLIGWLAERGENYAHAFENREVVRAAVDKVHARPETELRGAREIAFFPPMTGG